MPFKPTQSLSLIAALSLGLAGCMSSGGSQSPAGAGGSSLFSNWFAAQKTEPAQQAVAEAAESDVPCPKVDIREGGSTLRQGKGSDVTVQFSLRDVVRECSAGKNGAIVMKIGVEGIAVIGTAGKPGGVSAPLIITATKGEKVVSSKTITLKTTIPADENQAQFRMIDQGFTLPAGSDDADVTIGFKG
ncbi:MAG: hypothetical protein WCO61_03810 [Alphaproteobacteria bacterium]